VVGALGKHLALIGFMGAGKTTVGRQVAARIHRPFVDLDREIEKHHGPIPEVFESHGEEEFRRLEEQALAEALAGPDSVLAVGGGAVLSSINRERLAARAFCVLVHVDVETAWERVRGSDRPLARTEEHFRQLYGQRDRLYNEVADWIAEDVESVVLGALRVLLDGSKIHWSTSAHTAVVADERVLELHGPPVDGALHPIPPGEQAKAISVLERLWNELQLGRDGRVVAFGGGSTTDVAGYVAATYLRGLPWIAYPTTLVGQVDAAIGGKTGINLETAKNLVGAFHFPELVVIDPTYLDTLPEEERRAGMAEVVKTGLLAGREVWSLPETEMIRACAAFKAGVVLADPYERDGYRTILNLGHTFAHALEAGSGYRVRHGDAVALGLLAALRLSGQPTDAVEEILQPKTVTADPDAAWAALKRDKKGEGVFVLLERPGEAIVTTVPDEDARAALAALIAK
jgi:shikimate kinase / 3-dehydroquinate synthase